MPSTAALPSIFALSDSNRRAAYNAATERAMAAAHDAAENYKAQHRPDPRANDWLIYRSKGLVCVLVVKHWKPRDGAKSFAVSRDGGSLRPIHLPFSIVDQGLAESSDDFLLALVPRAWVDRIEKKDFVGAQPLRELFGITLPLSATREWTDAQAETWARLDRLRSDINWRIERARVPQMKRRRELTLTRNGTA